MDNTIHTNTNIVLDKKIEDSYVYNKNLHNFKAPQELTVEITLNEYRELVSIKTAHDYEICKINREKSDLTVELEKLRRQYEELKDKYLTTQMGGDDEQ